MAPLGTSRRGARFVMKGSGPGHAIQRTIQEIDGFDVFCRPGGKGLPMSLRERLHRLFARARPCGRPGTRPKLAETGRVSCRLEARGKGIARSTFAHG